MNSLIFVNTFEFLQNLLTFLKITVFEKKIQGYNRENFSTIISENVNTILECDLESYFKNISETFRQFFKQSTNLFDTKKRIVY